VKARRPSAMQRLREGSRSTFFRSDEECQAASIHTESERKIAITLSDRAATPAMVPRFTTSHQIKSVISEF
jgi:hypothetical protein